MTAAVFSSRFGSYRGRVLLLGLAGAVLLLSSCVYLRLLEVKKQLQDFDANFTIGGRSELVIEFKNPVLRTKDVRFLIGADPVFQTGEEDLVQHFEFDLVRPSSAALSVALERLSLDLVSRRGKLAKIIVPEKFMLLFPRNIVVETLKQAKDAEVFELKKLARAQIHLAPETEAELPSHAKTLLLLGEPLDSVPEGNLQVLTYRYRIVGAPREVPISVRLSFDADGLVRKGFVRWDQSSIEALFNRR